MFQWRDFVSDVIMNNFGLPAHALTEGHRKYSA